MLILCMYLADYMYIYTEADSLFILRRILHRGVGVSSGKKGKREKH